MKISNVNKILIILCLCLLSLIFSLLVGGSSSSPIKILNIIFNKMFNVELMDGISNIEYNIIWNIRLPRVLLSFIVGGMLSISGVIIQSILRNPLASSYTIGVSSGASLGIGILIVFNLGLGLFGYFIYPIVGFVCSILTVIFIIVLCKKLDRNMENNTIILIGMVISLFLNAMLTLISSLKQESLSSILIWQMGSFSSRGWTYVISIIPFMIIGVFGALYFSRELDILTFGDEMGKSVGVNISKVKVYLLIFVSILTGASIASSGIIGFVDLIVPHVSRKIFGSKHRIVIISSFLIGGIFMVLFDVIARVIIYPAELPIATINALVGTPIFCYIFFKSYRR